MNRLPQEELQKLPAIQSLEAALRRPEEAVRLHLHDATEDLADIAGLPELRELSVSWSDVSALLPHLEQLTRLQDLSFRVCHLT
ncbi:MAG: hypothetical protein EOP86_15710 [Verrucomicrobiaceae bacterium]|nr:MAG: hypothetical protein EOP86_15710 [Verrucomicrobiaceae bacterium]